MKFSEFISLHLVYFCLPKRSFAPQNILPHYGMFSSCGAGEFYRSLAKHPNFKIGERKKQKNTFTNKVELNSRAKSNHGKQIIVHL